MYVYSNWILHAACLIIGTCYVSMVYWALGLDVLYVAKYTELVNFPLLKYFCGHVKLCKFVSQNSVYSWNFFVGRFERFTKNGFSWIESFAVGMNGITMPALIQFWHSEWLITYVFLGSSILWKCFNMEIFHTKDLTILTFPKLWYS